jgi:HlyD family secretion protein
MDTPITDPRRPWRRAALAGVVVLALVALAWGSRSAPSLWGQSQTLSRERLSIATVSAGRFDDFIALRGQAAPMSTVFLDAVEGGRVERKLVDDGALVSAGQAIAVLGNSSLQLEVIRSEAEVANQLNNLRNVEIQIERIRADNERLLAEIDWQLQRTSQKSERDGRLAQVGFLAPAALRDTEDERHYLERRRDITLASQRADAALQAAQAAQLRVTTRQLQANLTLARANLDALTVRAPIAGRVTGFEVSVGQSLARGQRLGQIDSADAGRVLAFVDEFHLGRVAVDQAAELLLDGKSHKLRLAKINPQVKSGQFEVELVFDGAAPAGLRRGQTLQPRLALGVSADALLLPIGAFLADGGSASVFVVEGDAATRRNVTLGRRNVQHVEVLAGLKAGERVIVSSYAGLADKQQLRLTD